MKVWKVVRVWDDEKISCSAGEPFMEIYKKGENFYTVDSALCFVDYESAYYFLEVITKNHIYDLYELWEAEAEEMTPIEFLVEPMDLYDYGFLGDKSDEFLNMEIVELLKQGVEGDAKMVAPKGTILCKNVRLTEFLERSEKSEYSQ